MNDPTSDPTNFRPSRVLGVAVGALILGILVGCAVSRGADWSEGRALTSAAASVALVWLAAVILGVRVLVFGSGMSIDRIGFGVMAASVSRMFFALILGVPVFILLAPENRTFWICFVCAGVSILVAESWWAIRTVNSVTRTTGTRDLGEA